MDKITMKTPLVEMDGDEMTRIIWQMIKDDLLLPFIDLKTEYYDLGLKKRDETNDQITLDAAEATKKYGVAVKCATITPNAARVEEYNLKAMYKSPNGTIRAALDGTVFRAPILVKGIEPYVRTWKKPIIMARHAYGDVYKNTEYRVEGPGKAELVFTDASGRESRELIHQFTGAGIIQGMHNTDASIEGFARSCFNYALDQKMDLWFSTKDTISKIYDGNFKEIFQNLYDTEYKEAFEKAGLEYFYTLIDDAVARVMRSFRHRLEDECTETGAPFRSSFYVLGKADGSYLSPYVLTRWWAFHAREWGLVGTQGKTPVFHDLRHTFATVAVRNLDPKTAQSIMGHSNINMTMRYADTEESQVRAASRLLPF